MARNPFISIGFIFLVVSNTCLADPCMPMIFPLVTAKNVHLKFESNAIVDVDHPNIRSGILVLPEVDQLYRPSSAEIALIQKSQTIKQSNRIEVLPISTIRRALYLFNSYFSDYAIENVFRTKAEQKFSMEEMKEFLRADQGQDYIADIDLAWAQGCGRMMIGYKSFSRIRRL